MHMITAATQHSDDEVTILARFLTDGNEQLPKNLAGYILDLTISERDKARMHDLAVRLMKTLSRRPKRRKCVPSAGLQRFPASVSRPGKSIPGIPGR